MRKVSKESQVIPAIELPHLRTTESGVARGCDLSQGHRSVQAGDSHHGQQLHHVSLCESLFLRDLVIESADGQVASSCEGPLALKKAGKVTSLLP